MTKWFYSQVGGMMICPEMFELELSPEVLCFLRQLNNICEFVEKHGNPASWFELTVPCDCGRFLASCDSIGENTCLWESEQLKSVPLIEDEAYLGKIDCQVIKVDNLGNVIFEGSYKNSNETFYTVAEITMDNLLAGEG